MRMPGVWPLRTGEIPEGPHGRSMEAEVRAILTEAVRPESNWLQTWHARFHEVGGIELDLAPRGSSRMPPDFTS